MSHFANHSTIVETPSNAMDEREKVPAPSFSEEQFGAVFSNRLSLIGFRKALIVAA